MTFVDISPAVRPGAPVWPGDSEFEISRRWDLEHGDSVTVGTVVTTTHIGAHIDAPAHVIRGGATVDATPIDACVGPCVLLDVSDLVDRARHPHAPAPAAAVRSRVEAMTSAPVERLLLRHYSAPKPGWDADMPGVDPELLRWFAEQGGRLLGLDLASFDHAESTRLDAHRAGIERGVVLLEGLALSEAPEGAAELIALPLRWEGADASPVRAVLRTS